MNSMDVRRVEIGRLKVAAYNPRVGLEPGMVGYERLKRSIEEFDLVQPLVWNERTGHVVSGHQRLTVLKARGDTEVDCVVVSLALEREQALNVALNNPNVGGAWDPGKLVELGGELVGLPGFDATLIGFDADELRDLVLRPAERRRESGGRTPSKARGSRARACCRTRRTDVGDVEAGLVRVTLDIRAEDWERVRGPLDEIVGDFRLRAHVAAG